MMVRRRSRVTKRTKGGKTKGGKGRYLIERDTEDQTKGSHYLSAT